MDDFEDDFDWNEAFGEEISNDSTDTYGGPCKKRKTEKRKFPGPAGLLPTIQVDSENKHQLAKIKDKRENQNILESLGDADHDLVLTREELIDSNEAWKEILNQADLNASRYSPD